MISLDDARHDGTGGHLEFETLLFELSTKFISVPSEELDRAIEDVQRRLCELLQVDLSALWEETPAAPGDLVLTHFYASQEDLLPPMRGMSAAEYFPWLKQEMLAGRPVCVANLDDLPEAAAFDRANLRQFGVQSNLTLPLSVGGAVPVAALGFNTTRAPREWPGVLVTRLELVGQVFANALARKRADAALRESEAGSRLAADSAEAGLWTYDYRTRTFWVSDRTRAMFGYLPDEPMDLERLRRSVLDDDWPGVMNAIEEAARSREIVNVDYRVLLQGADGVRWISSRGRAHFSATGEAIRLMGLSVDITEKKRLDESIGTYQRFEALLIDISTELIDVSPDEMDRHIEDALDRVCRILGLDMAVVWQRPPDTLGLLVPTHSHPPLAGLAAAGPLSQESYPWVVGQVLEGQSVAVSRLDDLPDCATRDRESARSAGIRSSVILPLQAGVTPPLGAVAFSTLRDERDWAEALVARLRLIAQVFTNALARMRHDRALRGSEALSRATFEQAAVGIAHVGADGRWLRVNDKLCAIVGYSREELLKSTFQDITHPDDLETDLDHLQQMLAGSIETYSIEKRYLREDRSVVWVNLTVSLTRTADGAPRHFISVVEDISARKHDEEALRVSEARLETGADLAGLAFYELDYQAGTSYVDGRFRTLCGLPDDRCEGLAPFHFWIGQVHSDDRDRVLLERERLHSGEAERLFIEYRYMHPQEGQKWFLHVARIATRSASGRAVRAYGVLRDISARKLADEALRRSYVEIERLKDRLQAETDYLRAEIGEVLSQGEVTGKSPVLMDLMRKVQQVAATDSTVLVRGETGTGKELIARAIHRMSPRRQRVMVKVNCGALPSGLVESELFGREKGAFTGALSRQVGRFELADGSTVFLDEVGELPPEVQVKLLRVLQEGEFERLGSPRTIKVNVRVIAATNRDLLEEVRQGRFREDLYYRLNVFPLRVPPLRERTEDIPLLVWTFLEEFSSRMGKKITQVPRKTMDALMRHPWPGNVRELRNVIEHAAILTTGETLMVPRLGDDSPGAALPQTLADLERHHILRTLDTTGWRIKGPNGAAVVLGLNPATLYSRMKKLGIKSRRESENAGS